MAWDDEAGKELFGVNRKWGCLVMSLVCLVLAVVFVIGLAGLTRQVPKPAAPPPAPKAESPMP